MAFTTLVGARIRRREDPRLITGRATYVDDVKTVGTLYAAFVRSPFAHARIKSIDLSAAKAHPGVFGAFVGADLARAGVKPLPVVHKISDVKAPEHPPLAIGEARYLGEPVAVVVANDPYAARDASELVAVDYEPLDVVVDLFKALEGGPFVHRLLETNVAFTMPFSAGDVEGAFKGADAVIEQRIVNQRLAPVPIEPRGVLAQWNRGDGALTVTLSTQIPHLLRTQLGGLLGLSENRIRVIAPEVGGGFGCKADVYAEDVIVPWLSMQLDRPVKYIETRSECFRATIHGRDQIDDVALAVRSDGTIVGMRLRVVANLGAYLQLLTPVIPTLTLLMAPGPYRIPALQAEVIGVYTNTMPTDAYRGAGRPEATYLLERMLDLVAQRLGLDPADVRRRNFVAPDAFPYQTTTGLLYDSGQYESTMDVALEAIDYAGLRKQRDVARKEGRLVGIGISSYVEVCGMGPSAAMPGPGWESATVRVEPTGGVTVLAGISPHGQGEETTFAQIVADELGVPIETVTVVHGDTDKVQYGVGTYGSRGTPVGGAALKLAIESIQAKAIKIAAHQWEANPDDLEYRGGKIQVKGDPSKTMTTAEAGLTAWLATDLPPGVEPGLDATRRFEPPNFVFPFGTHVCVVEIDRATGEIKLERYLAVDDCGKIINPMLVGGQLHGGIAQGIGQALFEELVYDENGGLVNGSLMDYAVPHAAQLLDFELEHTTTPTDVNPLGVKGIGEAGTIGSTPAIVNAVVDALAPLGITHLDMPLRPEKIWTAIRGART